MRKRSVIVATVVAASLSAAGPASAHFLVVTPQGEGSGPDARVHVGQLPPEHNSCFDHLTAGHSEQSEAVTFRGPSLCQ